MMIYSFPNTKQQKWGQFFCLIIETEKQRKRKGKTCGHSLVVGEMTAIFSQLLLNISDFFFSQRKQSVNRQRAGGDVSLSWWVEILWRRIGEIVCPLKCSPNRQIIQNLNLKTHMSRDLKIKMTNQWRRNFKIIILELNFHVMGSL